MSLGRCKHGLRDLAVGEVQGPHLKQVPAAEPPTDPGGEVDCKAVHQRRTVVGARVPVLPLLDDPNPGSATPASVAVGYAMRIGPATLVPVELK